MNKDGKVIKFFNLELKHENVLYTYMKHELIRTYVDTPTSTDKQAHMNSNKHTSKYNHVYK